jgi:hypothetical protein
MKFYEFVDRSPEIGTLAFVEGTERELADRAVATIVDRLLPISGRSVKPFKPCHSLANGAWSSSTARIC